VNGGWPGPLVLFPATVGARLDGYGSTWGWFDLKFDDREQVVLIAKFWNKDSSGLPYVSAWQDRHYLHYADTVPRSGVWYRCDPELHVMHSFLYARRVGTAPAEIRSRIKGGWIQPPTDRPFLVMALSRTDSDPVWSAWWVSRESAWPARFEVVDDARQPIDFIRDEWPVEELSQVLVTIVGVGSIGSGAADALASNAVGRIALVDPDRLLQRNLVRHKLSDVDLGRFKVRAMSDQLTKRYPHLQTEIYPLDVVSGADVMRPLFARSDVVLCASDGVTSRRVANHLARRVGVPIVLAAVLEDGAFGEVIRVRQRTGCLLCLRRLLQERDVLDPEPRIDLDYGTGTAHRPMTASPADLHLVAEVAAKAVIGTVLEVRGRWNQRLPGDWGIIGLQPSPDLPEPFDVERTGEIRWRELPRRRDDCPTCAPP
jgi:molybdopterin-synthase adenylyltransferase